MLTEQTEHDDGRVELVAGTKIEGSRLYNDDLAPTTVARRNWTTYNFAALWISMAHCIPTYMLAAGLIEAGMNWKQALVTILLGNLIVLIPILLNSHPGTKYGIPFPVFARAAYGTFGSNLPALMRAIVACGWFGIQCWIGGKALHTFLAAMWPGWTTALGGHVFGYYPTQWCAFLAFWGMNIWIIYRGMDLLRKVENWAAPYVLVMTLVLVVWAVKSAHGLGPILATAGRYQSTAQFMRIFVPSLTAMIGFWATLSLNMPDFTRFGRSQRDQAVGQVVALPTTMTVFAAMGVVITSATAVIYHAPVWDPMDLAAHFTSRAVVAIAMFTVVVATLAVNIAANVVSPANDFANAFPRWITFRRGGLLTGLIGIAMCPWKLVADPSGYIFRWLLGYSGGLGSIAGVLIVDYWLIKRTKLDLADLYRPDGRYAYAPMGGSRTGGSGINFIAVGATLLGCLVAWIGIWYAPLHALFEYSWFTGGLTAGIFYYYVTKLVGNRAEAATPTLPQRLKAAGDGSEASPSRGS